MKSSEQEVSGSVYTKREWSRLFQEDVFVHMNELHQAVGPLNMVPFWKAVSIGYYLSKGLSIEAAVKIASEDFNPLNMDCYELAKDAKWTGVMPNNAADEFAVFEDGDLLRKIPKDEALRLCPNVRTFPIS